MDHIGSSTIRGWSLRGFRVLAAGNVAETYILLYQLKQSRENRMVSSKDNNKKQTQAKLGFTTLFSKVSG